MEKNFQDKNKNHDTKQIKCSAQLYIFTPIQKITEKTFFLNSEVITGSVGNLKITMTKLSIGMVQQEGAKVMPCLKVNLKLEDPNREIRGETTPIS